VLGAGSWGGGLPACLPTCLPACLPACLPLLQLLILGASPMPRPLERQALLQLLHVALCIAGVPFNSLTLQHLSLAQLQSLHLAGRRGLHVPTLNQLLE
jgi:hypothetical protein